MLYVLNTENLDDIFIEKLKNAEKKIFLSDKTIRNSDKLSLCGRILLGYILKKNFGIDAFSYSYGKNGKPYLRDCDIFFSISHSGNYVICCVSENEIGCDIEKIKDYNPKVCKRFFTEKEANLLKKRGNEDVYFSKLWTLKESILKKEGTGISGGLDTYCFADRIDEESFFAYGYSFFCFRFYDYMISVCSENIDMKTENVPKENIDEFIETLD